MSGGRPRKPVERTPAFVTVTNASLDRLEELAARIAGHLRHAPETDTTIKALAMVAVHYELNADIKENAPLIVKRQGRRPNIHLAELLAKCAQIYAAESGASAEEALRKIGGWEEDKCIQDSKVLIYAKAVLGALGIKR